MKIVQINTFSYKAAGNIMTNIHKALLENGHDSYIVWGRGRAAETDNEYCMNNFIGIHIDAALTRITDKAGRYSIRATKHLIKWLDTIQPDIIHLHCMHGYYINLKILFEYIKKKKIRVIWTQHDCWTVTGHCAYFDMVRCDKWKNGCYDCQQIHTYPKAYIDNSKKNWKLKRKYFTGLNATIVLPCNWLNNIIKKSFLNIYKSIVIYNGINTEQFKPAEQISVRKNIVLGVAGEWTERKGLKDFIKLRELLSNDYEIVLIGLTDNQIKMLPNGIRGIKRTENIQELVEYYTQAYVFLNPTYEDNFPTTNLEALACGTPVITYDTGGCSECIAEGVNGYVLSKGDIKKAAELICGKKWIYPVEFDSKNFSKNRMTRSYLELYEKN